MADETENEEAAGGKGGPSWVLVIIAALVSLGAGAGGAYFMLAGEAEAEVEPVEVETVNPAVEFSERLVSLDPFVVNVGGDGYARFLKLKVELEADSPETKEELDARRPQIRDTTILLLSSRRLGDVTEFEGKALLKDDLRERINALLERGKVESVLSTEFVVQ